MGVFSLSSRSVTKKNPGCQPIFSPKNFMFKCLNLLLMPGVQDYIFTLFIWEPLSLSIKKKPQNKTMNSKPVGLPPKDQPSAIQIKKFSG